MSVSDDIIAGDPVFAAIDAHMLAEGAAKAAFDKNVEGRLDDRVRQELYNRATDALAALVKTTPTTMAGCIALLRYLEIATDEGSGLLGVWQEHISGPAANLLSRIAAILETQEAQS